MTPAMADLFGVVCKMSNLRMRHDELMRSDGGMNAIVAAADLLDQIVDAIPELQKAFHAADESRRLNATPSSAPIVPETADKTPRRNARPFPATPSRQDGAGNLVEMANVGEALMEAIRDYSSHSFMQSWSPADCPTEIVGDLLNALDEAGAALRPIETMGLWDTGVVTDGERAAVAQKAESDFGGHYFAIEPEDALEWEPTHWAPFPDRAALSAAPATLRQDGLREALDFIDKFFEPWGAWKTAWWEGEVSDNAAFSDDNALKHVANILRRAALSDTPPPDKAAGH